MRDQDVAHPRESRQDRCFEVLNKEWTADNVDLAFRQFVSNFATVVSNGHDVDEAIPTWERKDDRPQTNVLGGSFIKKGIKVVVRYQRVDGMNGSNEFSLLAKYGDGQLQSERLFMSDATRGKVYYQPSVTSDLVLNGEVFEYPPMTLEPHMLRAGCVNAWNLYCSKDEDFVEEEDEDERDETIFNGLTDAFEDPPAYNEASVMKLARVIERMRRDDFEGKLPNSAIEQVIVRHLEGSREQLENCTSDDRGILAEFRENVDYWLRMQELMKRVRQADVVLRDETGG
ncbi:MAG: hypothetical protein UT84_C0002G0016 [Candidatus Curtissbacteria bacterium GW2011_GWA1_40_16]|uniref:Uncharacterized protein n=1 Tax=Candidatus Curtissbacteria bacterium GW2011_GWA1_40_16 TaxID=1618405 RepID=A0A0G0TVT8_9BACT|nr:MAG: hypothetical protein UT84_C0002G0016 [Candidatus Curtissbacteria bacterium GW2011_GWA1_40_16]